MAYSHGIIIVLPTETYTCDMMDIIDYLYIGILPPTIHKVVTNNLTRFILHQITQHYDRCLLVF